MSNNSPLQLSLFPDQDFATATQTHHKPQQQEKNSLEFYIEQQKAKLSPSWQQPQEFEVEVADSFVLVSFEPWVCTYHFQFYGKTVSPTGYRSHFIQLETAKFWDSPVAYAEQKAQDLHKELLTQQQRERKNPAHTRCKK